MSVSAPRKFKVPPWQGHPSHVSYPKWMASPIPLYTFTAGTDSFPPLMSTKHRSSLLFDTKEEALAYYESREYHMDYVTACHDYARGLCEVVKWLQNKS